MKTAPEPRSGLLEPCPVCDGPAHVSHVLGRASVRCFKELLSGDHLVTWGATREEAAKRWNHAAKNYA